MLLHRRSRLRTAAALVPILALAWVGTASASSFADPADFDLDGVPNATDTCVVVADAENRDTDGNGVGDACDGQGPNPTVEAIRSMPQAQIDELFGTLDAGPMPGWKAYAYGQVINPTPGLVNLLCPTCHGDKQKIELVAATIWQGKVWYTNASGGLLYNRMLNDTRVWRHRVSYRTSKRDRRPVIRVDPQGPVFDGFYDDIRMVQPGIYVGMSLMKTYGWGRDQRVLTFTLDFTNPELSDAQCPVCAAERRLGR